MYNVLHTAKIRGTLFDWIFIATPARANIDDKNKAFRKKLLKEFVSIASFDFNNRM